MKWLTNIGWWSRTAASAVGATAVRVPHEPANKKPPMQTTKAITMAQGRTGGAADRKRRSMFPKPIAALQRATSQHFIYDGTFYEAIGPVLAMAQCFGVMPVLGIQSAAGVTALRFKWWTVRTVYAFVMFVLTFMFTMLTVVNTLDGNLSFDGIVPIIFYVSVLYIRFCFGRMARRWPELMRHWARVEQQMPALQTHMERQRLAYRIKIVSIVVMTMSLAEHVLNIISIVSYSNRCNPNQADPIRNYFLAEQSQLFRFVEYRPVLAFMGKVINSSATFLWTYMDLFVILVSLGLASRFRQINESLRRYKGAAMPEQFWREHRVWYRSMCDLCNAVDDAVAHITMVSFANNLYFVCVQLLRSLNPMPSFAHSVYFWFSLTFLITRTLAVSLYAANINDESKKPARVFRAVPRESWCLEVKRFSDEVTYDVVALSGMKFFHITRKLVLSVAGTIVTYELVLIQFNDATKNGEKAPCT